MNLNMSPTTSWGMSSRSPIPESPRRGLRGGHVLLIFIGFLATIFLVNGIMVYDALSTFGGLETPVSMTIVPRMGRTSIAFRIASTATWSE